VSTEPVGGTGFIEPAELRARVFTILGEGADGLLYRHDWSADLPDLNAAIPPLNAEVGHLIPWLTIGTARGEAQVDGPPGVRATTRWAGDRGMIVFCVDENAGGRASTASDAATSMRVVVPLPEWAEATGVSRVTPDGLVAVEDAVLSPVVTFRAPAPDGGDAYIVHFRAPAGDRQ